MWEDEDAEEDGADRILDNQDRILDNQDRLFLRGPRIIREAYIVYTHYPLMLVGNMPFASLQLWIIQDLKLLLYYSLFKQILHQAVICTLNLYKISNDRLTYLNIKFTYCKWFQARNVNFKRSSPNDTIDLKCIPWAKVMFRFTVTGLRIRKDLFRIRIRISYFWIADPDPTRVKGWRVIIMLVIA